MPELESNAAMDDESQLHAVLQPEHLSFTSKKERQSCILVLGMHRSGTSVLTRVINLLGATLPQNLMGAHPTNEGGHWEPERLVDLHDQILAEAGSRWYDWRELDLSVLSFNRLEFYKTEIRRLIEEEYGDAPLFVLKDPRICRFVPLYQDILSDMKIDAKYTLIHRNPLAVAASLKARNEIPKACSQLLWLRHVLEAEKTTRGYARIFLSYEALLADDGRQVSKLAAALDVTWPEHSADTMAEIRRSVRQDLQHQKDGAEALANTGLATRWLEALWLALEEAANSGMEQIVRFQSVDRAFCKAEEIAARADFSEASALAVILAGGQNEIVGGTARVAMLDGDAN
jgi:hypothetical protein